MNNADFFMGVRVYIEDTDAAGIVYYVNYLKFMERARSDWLRCLGLTQAQLRADGVKFVVSRCAVEFHQPARLDDDLRVTVDVKQIGHASLIFRQEVYREDELLCAADVKVACIHSDRMQPVALPADIRRQLVNEE